MPLSLHNWSEAHILLSIMDQAVAAAAAGIVLRLRRNRRKKPECWLSEYPARWSVCVSVEGEVGMARNVLFKKFTGMSPSDFERVDRVVPAYANDFIVIIKLDSSRAIKHLKVFKRIFLDDHKVRKFAYLDCADPVIHAKSFGSIEGG